MKKLGLYLMFMLAMMACLAGCAPKGEALVIASVPWSEDETATYSIQTQAGETLGSATISIIQDGDTWVLTDHEVVNNSPDDIKLTVSADNLKPLAEERTLVIPADGSIPAGTWKISASFGEGKLTVEAETPQGHQSPAEVKLPADAFANDEVLFLLLRALPFAEGYTAYFSDVILWPNVQMPQVTITVIGKEALEIPAGSYEAWKVEASVAGAKQYFWYSAEKPNQLLKYDNGSTIFLPEQTGNE
jgi:hypothetical protein